jgi:hypothetical protein
MMSRHHRSNASLRLGLAIFTGGALTLALSASPAWSATAPNLGVAGAASVVAGSAVTNTGSSTLSGNVEVFPGTSVTGFPPGIIGGTESSGGPTGGPADSAAAAVTNAYLQVAAAPSTAVMNSDLGGKSLTPGVYSASSSMALTGTVTLVGTAGSVFIFQAVSSLITAPGSRVVLSGGVQACNVYWQVGSSATIGTTTAFVGNILALSSITMQTGATLSGRALARNGAVTLDDNTITSPTCNAVSATTTSTTSVTTTTTHKAPTTTTTKPKATKTTTPKKTAPKAKPPATTTTTTPARGATTTTTPPLVGAPVTGGGPLRPTSNPWPFAGVDTMMVGGGLLFAGVRRVRVRRS